MSATTMVTATVSLGFRFYDFKSGRRTGRVNMIAALCAQQLLAPFTIEGARIAKSLRRGWKYA
ncbi:MULTISPECIES: hypothetical protein [unclassified Nostoc]|uniref:hypothetical protein n=1 Tax=unclassified Nostoc TaxID=2593658 RepID=UPI002AD3DDBA|nr:MULTISPECIES: hypothetical protein [unclassified Nostoc]MDZ8121356.1 hypothetical protein [Nostoc sp. CmiVER01]MDZ8228047.1 hypothetical protein [Nostoc sp. ChiVER01]